MDISHLKVSILMNCYNGARYLREAMDSVFAQTHQNFEIIFVDNCSTDESAEIAKSYQDERVKYCKTPKNIPLYHARNFGLDHVSGDFVCVLDTDDFWAANKLERQLVALETRQLDFCYSGCRRLFTGDRTVKAILAAAYLGFVDFWKSSRLYSLDEILNHYNINLQTIMIRWSVIQNERFIAKLNLAGDQEFFIRIIKKFKMTPFFIGQYLATYRVHPAQLSHASSRNWFKEMRYIYFFSFLNLLTPDELAKYQQSVDMWKYKYLRDQGKIERANQVMGLYKWKSPILFYHYFKTLMQKRRLTA